MTAGLSWLKSGNTTRSRFLRGRRWPPTDLPWVCMAGPQPGAPEDDKRPAFDLDEWGVKWFDVGVSGYPGMQSIYPVRPERTSPASNWDPTAGNAVGLLLDFEGTETTEVSNGTPGSIELRRNVEWFSEWTYPIIADEFPKMLRAGYELGWPQNNVDGHLNPPNYGSPTWETDRLRMLDRVAMTDRLHMTGISLYNTCHSGNVESQELGINTWTREGTGAVAAMCALTHNRCIPMAILTSILFFDDEFDPIPDAQLLSQSEAAVEGGARIIFYWDEFAYRHGLQYDDSEAIAHQQNAINIFRRALSLAEIS